MNAGNKESGWRRDPKRYGSVYNYKMNKYRDTEQKRKEQHTDYKHKAVDKNVKDILSDDEE